MTAPTEVRPATVELLEAITSTAQAVECEVDDCQRAAAWGAVAEGALLPRHRPVTVTLCGPCLADVTKPDAGLVCACGSPLIVIRWWPL